MERTIDANISFVKWEEGGEVGYTIYLGGDNDSGINVTGSTKDEVLENLKPYLFDKLDELDD